MPLPPPALASGDLFLRKPLGADAAVIFARYAQDPLVCRYLAWPPHLRLKTTREFVAQCVWQWRATSTFPYCICLAGTQGPIGMISMRLQGFKAEFGYVLARPFWGRGLMTQALGLLLGWTFSQGSIYRAWGVCDCDNCASAAVMARAGMHLEGTLQRWHVAPALSEQPRDCRVYAKVR